MNLHRPSYSIDLNQGQQQQQLYDRQILLHRHSFSTFESHSPPIYSNPVQDDQLGSYLYMGSSPYHEHEVGGSYGSGSYDQTTLERKEAKSTKLKFTICKKEEQTSGGGDEINGSNVKWLPLRIMKNLMRGDEDQKHQLMSKTLKGDSSNFTGGGGGCNNNENNTAIRVCSDCNTTKTPLWRSGPRGPKSLCNACGIRQRKARRAMAMAANGSPPPSVMKAGNGHKKTANNNNIFGGQKKRSKVVKPSRDNHHYNPQRKLCFEEFALNLSKKLSVQQVFPQEEKEAAILLMALSCGFVHG